MIDFFQGKCRQENIINEKFGICDDENNTAAYIDIVSPDKWGAVVNNPDQKAVSFTAIDCCIEILRENGDQDNRCDAMLDYEDNIIFVELKNYIKGGWITLAFDQLETTLSHFTENHDLNQFKHKRAFVINKKKNHFQVIESEQKRRFFVNYKVRINVGGEIKI